MMTAVDLTGRRVLVTGAPSRIGKPICRGLDYAKVRETTYGDAKGVDGINTTMATA